MRTEREQIVAEMLIDVKGLLADVKGLLRERCIPQLVDAPTLARMLSVDAHTIYRNAKKLGGIKIGSSLRFDPAVAIERARIEKAPAPKPRRSRRPVESDTPLLPIR